MGSDFAVQVQVDPQVLSVLAALRRNMDDMTPAWQDAGDELMARADQRFNTKTDPNGNPWEPWKPATKKMRTKEGRGTLLEYSRLLRQSLDAEAGPSGMVLGLGRSYGPFHEFGTRRMARRGILLGEISPEPRLGAGDEKALLDILMEHLTGGLNG